jgi:threonylcarbamoyladenosine tRNA methylthiotransferase MtaB
MKRGYTREEFLEKLNQLHQINPMAFLATDIIVGFLDENDRDFEETYNFLRDSPISKFHVFRFSKREKTAAFYMAKRLKEPTAAEKIRRAKALSELSKRKYQAFLVKHLGKTFPALFLEKKIEGYQEALLDNQIPAFIKTSKNLVGEIKTIKIKKMNSDKLFGEL